MWVGMKRIYNPFRDEKKSLPLLLGFSQVWRQGLVYRFCWCGFWRLPILCLGLLRVQMALCPCLHQAIWSHGWNMAPGFPGILSVGGTWHLHLGGCMALFSGPSGFLLILLTLLLVKVQKSENCHCESLRNLSFSLESFANLRILPLHPTAF